MYVLFSKEIIISKIWLLCFKIDSITQGPGPEPDPSWAKILGLDPDPKSVFDPQH